MKKSLIVMQDGYKECGAASLLSIIHYYKGNISISRLLEMTNTDNEGTNFYELKKAGEEIGLEAIGYQVDDISTLKEIDKPFICQLIYNNLEHFVVIYKIKHGKVQMMDPAYGEKNISLEELKKIWTSYIMIFSPKKKLATYQEKKYINNIIIQTIKNNKRIVLDILLLSIIFTILSFICTLYFEIVLDNIIETTLNNLLIITFIFSILSILKIITNFFRNELLIILNQKIDCSCFLNSFQKILLLPYSYYKNKTTGETISRMNDLIYVKNILNKIILTVCLDVIICISCSLILLIKNQRLFLLLIIIIIIYVIIFYLFRNTLKKYTETIQRNSAKVNSYLIETINGYETIKNMNLERTINNIIEKLYINSLKDSFDYNNIVNLEIFTKDIVSSVGILLVQFIGLTLVMKNQLTIGSLLTFTFLTNYILDPIKNILDTNKEYYYAKNAIKRANHLFEIESENLTKTTNYILKGNISINHLTFKYKEDRQVIKDISLKIQSGEKLMILGKSGSGKSSIIKLLLKYYSTNRNCIYLDEIDINDISLGNIREQITCLTQNEILYNDTIKNNIIMNRQIKEEEFQEIVKLTHVEDFVKTMFLGYDTQLEENGINLSSGQRQRIMLARMLLKPSNIIMIDEGLNAIDINLERSILKKIISKYQEKTFIIISHRTENIDLFEHIVEIEEGTIKKEIRKPKEDTYYRQIHYFK